MATNNKPATALPWTCDSGESENQYWHYASLYCGVRLVARLQLTNGPSGNDGQANAAYIVHAANAYSRLVAALDDVQRAHAGDGISMARAVDQALLLLAELGEAQS